MTNRDEFPVRTRQALALRASYICSFPGCGLSTVGPSEEAPDAVTMIGVAAHICAAAPGPGARRHDPSMTPAQRISYDNGIWLCQNHAVVIDRDEISYTADSLREMRRRHEASRGFEPRNSSASADDIIALGPNIIGVGDFMGYDTAGIRVSLKHFISGDPASLMSFASDFHNVTAEDRYLLINALGDGRLLASGPAITRAGSDYHLVLPLLPSAPRSQAQSFGTMLARHPQTNDLFVQNGRLARVSGLEAFASHLESSLGLALGENVFHPRSGTRIARFYQDFAMSPWLSRLIKMEVIRLASIPREDRLLGTHRTSLLCVDRVREVEILADAQTNNRLPMRIVLDLNGTGRWERDMSVFVHTNEQLAAIDQREIPEWLVAATG